MCTYIHALFIWVYMNIRQQKYKKNRIAGMNAYNAAISAGYAHAYAVHATERIDPKLTSLNNYLERVGLTDKVLAQKLSQLTDATKVIGYLHQYQRGDKGRIEKISPQEVISNEFIETPDNQIRLKALELLAKLKQHLSDKVHIDQSTHIKQIVWEVNGSKIQAPRKPRPNLDRPEQIPGIGSGQEIR